MREKAKRERRIPPVASPSSWRRLGGGSSAERTFGSPTETDGGQIAESARHVETTALTAVGQARAFEFVADEPGDWAMHCHMTHHVMTQMGDEFPNMIGVKPGKLDQKTQKLLPGYMTMGTDGMGDMAQMGMPVPKNSMPMVGGQGPFDYITMGGLFTVLKVREGLTSYEDPGWYQHPPGTVASLASAEELKRDLDMNSAAAPPLAAAPVYTCTMHPEVRQNQPGNCPKCGMTLVQMPKAVLPSGHSGH